MIRLTKELQFVASLLQGGIAGVKTQELDFNLARRSGVVINSIESTILSTTPSGDTTDEAVQEVDLDPDNVDVEGGSALLGDSLNSDTSRLIRHFYNFVSRITVTEAVTVGHSRIAVDFRMLPLDERPISITNLRHHLRFNNLIGVGGIEGFIFLRYIIVELTLQELGIINAGRR